MDVYLKQYDGENTTKSQFDETIQKEYKSPVPIRCLVMFEPTEEMLNEAGMTKEEAEIILKMSSLDLQKRGLMQGNQTLITQDDMITVRLEDFDIKKIRHHVHYQDHLMVSIGAIRA